MTNSRTEYQKNWRHTHPENVRKNKRTSYWNNPEKYRKKSRETWHKNKGSTTTGKSNDMTAELVKMSPTTFYRGRYVQKYARNLFEMEKSKPRNYIYPLYKKVKLDVDRFVFDLILLGEEKGVENITEQDMKDIATKYENLTFPFRA